MGLECANAQYMTQLHLLKVKAVIGNNLVVKLFQLDIHNLKLQPATVTLQILCLKEKHIKLCMQENLQTSPFPSTPVQLLAYKRGRNKNNN